MAMSETTLATEMEVMTPTASEAAAISRFVTAYGDYVSDAESNEVDITEEGVDLGKAAMGPALVGINSVGLARFIEGLNAFWGAVAGGLATSFGGATAITPPPHSNITSQFPTTPADNIDAIVALLHDEATTGGTVTFPGPITADII